MSTKKRFTNESIRLNSWDYAWNGSYFITINTSKRKHWFGSIEFDEVFQSDIGILAHKFWKEIPNHFNFVTLGAYIIMPNHIHGIININKYEPDPHERPGFIPPGLGGPPRGYHASSGHCPEPTITNNNQSKNPNPVSSGHCPEPTITNNNQSKNPNPVSSGHCPEPSSSRYQNIGKNSISSIIGSYKSIVTKNARKINQNFQWQPRFWDRLIQTEDQYRIVERYIRNNPKNWKKP